MWPLITWISLYHLQSKEGVKGRYWFPETELKSGIAVKMDKTGKSILMLLRHLGRLAEVRHIFVGRRGSWVADWEAYHASAASSAAPGGVKTWCCWLLTS